MKKLIYFAIALFVTTLVISCSNEEENTQNAWTTLFSMEDRFTPVNSECCEGQVGFVKEAVIHVQVNEVYSADTLHFLSNKLIVLDREDVPDSLCVSNKKISFKIIKYYKLTSEEYGISTWGIGDYFPRYICRTTLCNTEEE